MGFLKAIGVQIQLLISFGTALVCKKIGYSTPITHEFATFIRTSVHILK
jgi:hypothetical protein